MAQRKRVVLKCCLCGLGTFAFAGALFLVWAVQFGSDAVGWGTYSRIQIGMTEAEVEALLGGPGEEPPVPLYYKELHAHEQPELLLKSAPHTYRHWRSDSHMISVVVGHQGRVVAKSYSRAPDDSLLRRFLDWFGL
jgi:hypothetical protein